MSYTMKYTKSPFPFGEKFPKLKETGENISKFQSELTKKHPLYKSKKLTLSGQVDMPKLNVGWKSGGPTMSVKNRAKLSGTYKLGKKTTLSGGVEYASGKKPYYTAGLKINL